jgi:hypothetical protein
MLQSFYQKIFLIFFCKKKRFIFCSEINTKLSNLGIKIVEIPIKYYGRDYNSGKKIGLKDAFASIKAIIDYNYFDRYYLTKFKNE